MISDWREVLVLPAALRQLAENGDAELVEELIAMFETDTAQRLETLRAAVESRDYTTVNAEAHTIKGSAVQMGANRLGAICQQMESEAKQGQPQGMSAMLRGVLSSFDEVCHAIALRNSQTSRSL